jgi:hypothetical protein
MMDLVLYEDIPQSDLQGHLSGLVGNNLRNVQSQAAAWLRKIVLTVVPGLPARTVGTGDGHVLP